MTLTALSTSSSCISNGVLKVGAGDAGGAPDCAAGISNGVLKDAIYVDRYDGDELVGISNGVLKV